MNKTQTQTSETVEIYPRLDYRMSTGSGKRRDPNDYLLDFHVKISAIYDPDDDSECSRELHLGNLRATRIRMGLAGEEGCDMFEIFDQSQELCHLGEHLFKPDFEEFTEPVRAAFPYAEDYGDVLLIRDLTLHPAVRGQRVGISALHRFISEWQDGCSFVALQALPTQFLADCDGWDGWQDATLSGFPADRAEATAKLENHLCGLGFTAVETVPFLLLCPTMRQAPLDELALEDVVVVSRDALAGLQ